MGSVLLSLNGPERASHPRVRGEGVRRVTAVGFTRKGVLGLVIVVTLVGVACAKSTPTSTGASPSTSPTGSGSGGNPYGGGGKYGG